MGDDAGNQQVAGGTAKRADSLVPRTQVVAQRVERCIYLIRGEKVMLDSDLAELYGVETKALTRAVRRNLERFPPDFMFQLTKAEFDDLKCQIGASSGWGGRRYSPYAFTEQGVAMLSGVLRSPRAIEVNVEIMRAFVRLRRILTEHEDLKRQLASLEKKYDASFRVVFAAIRKLMDTDKAVPKRRQIGFGREEESDA